MMDDKISDRGDVATHKRHGRHYNASNPHSTSTSTTSASSSTTAAANSFSSLLRRYAPVSLYPGGPASRKPKSGAPMTATAAAGSGAPDHIELYTIRDKTDATAKRAFRVQIPVRLMYSVGAVFLILPILLFGWKETHLKTAKQIQQDQHHATARLRRSDQQARQDSNWMEEHLLTNDAEAGVSQPQLLQAVNSSSAAIALPLPGGSAAEAVELEHGASQSEGLPVTATEEAGVQRNVTTSSMIGNPSETLEVRANATIHEQGASNGVTAPEPEGHPVEDAVHSETDLEAELAHEVIDAVGEDDDEEDDDGAEAEEEEEI